MQTNIEKFKSNYLERLNLKLKFIEQQKVINTKSRVLIQIQNLYNLTNGKIFKK